MKKILGVIFSVTVVLLLLCAGAFYYLFLPLGSEGEEIVVVIERGTSLRSIASTMEEKGVVTSSTALLVWLKVRGLEKKIQAGKVTLTVGEGALSASEKLLKAEDLDEVITIHEGFTIEQTAHRLISKFPIDTTEFIALCYDTSFVRELGIEGASSLEGYLFPDTYRFPENITAETIIRRMVSRFLELYKTVEGDSTIINKYSRHELITVASIVEKEATLASERGRIAGVFHNRLRIGYPLGADPTIRYIFGKFDGPLRVSELNVDNPYNTRRFKGIPPGPICSPGLACIQATLSPDSTEDLYFVAKWDGTGAHDFSKTYQEHNRKKLMIRRENELRKRREGNETKKQQ